MQTIVCESVISSVTVYARGALITRDVMLGEALPAESVILRVPQVSVLALPGSFRASIAGGREVVSLRSQLCLPEVASKPGELAERLRVLRQEAERISGELGQSKELRDLLASCTLRPKLGEERFRAEQLLQKMKGSIAASKLTGELRASIEAKQLQLEERQTQLAKQISAVELEIRQASEQETLGQQRRTREALIQLSASGEVRELRLTYAVQAARWWPAYAARINGEQVKFSLDAFVAQATEEDWKNVTISLSTADMIHDARLPELASLRFSKVQPAPKRAFRAPPKGLDILYHGFDDAFASMPPAPVVPPVTVPSAGLSLAGIPALAPPKSGGIFSRLSSLMKSDLNDALSKAEDPEKMLNQVILEMNTQLVAAKNQTAIAIADEKRLALQFEAAALNGREWEKKAMIAVRAGDDALSREALGRKVEHDKLTSEYQKQHQLQKYATDKLKNALRGLQNKLDEARRKKDLLIARSKRAEAQKTIQSTLTGMTDTSAWETFDRMAQKVDQMEAEAEAGNDLALDSSGGGLDDKFAQLEAGSDSALDRLKEKMGLKGHSSFTQMTAQLSEAMLDFRLLELSTSGDRSIRGRLQIVTQSAVYFQASIDLIEECRAPLITSDPLYGRGQFDSMYHASASCDVPSNARAHRISVKSADAASQQEFLCLPKEDESVYRYLVLTNPFEASLLSGPVDIFIAGAFVTTSSLTAVDKGGKLQIGLGVEDRIKVVRNARVQESTLGILRGRTEVDHFISIEATSSLTIDASLRVLDRIPVTDQKDLEVAIVSELPEASAYDQSERGLPVRGGREWRLTVRPNQRTKISLHYKLSLPTKNEVIGGNRRD